MEMSGVLLVLTKLTSSTYCQGPVNAKCGSRTRPSVSSALSYTGEFKRKVHRADSRSKIHRTVAGVVSHSSGAAMSITAADAMESVHQHSSFDCRTDLEKPCGLPTSLHRPRRSPLSRSCEGLRVSWHSPMRRGHAYTSEKGPSASISSAESNPVERRNSNDLRSHARAFPFLYVTTIVLVPTKIWCREYRPPGIRCRLRVGIRTSAQRFA